MSESYTSSILSNVSTSSLTNTGSNMLSNMVNKTGSFLKHNSTIRTIIYIVIVVLTMIILVNLIIKSYNIFIEIKQKSPWLLYGTKDAKKYQYVIQDIQSNPLQLIKPSINRAGGLEFTYGCWIYIDDYDVNKGSWKNIFHKGSSENIDCPHSSSASSSQCPGLWLGPNNNDLYVFLNTFKNIDSIHTTGPTSTAGPTSTSGPTSATGPSAQSCNTYDHDTFNKNKDSLLESEMVNNIPVNNWVNIIVAVRQNNLDIYINGILKKRKLLKYLPKQNNGAFHMNAKGGFSGYLSNVRYFNYYITEGELFKYVSSGPSAIPPKDVIATPPYLAERWWLR